MNLNHVTIVVSDFERAKDFYKTLGLIQIVDSPPRYARFLCPDGDTTVSVEVTGEQPAQPGVELFFQRDDVDATVTALREKGLAFYQEPTDMFYQWREARLRDPDGHDIRFYSETADYRLNPPWKIKD